MAYRFSLRECTRTTTTTLLHETILSLSVSVSSTKQKIMTLCSTFSLSVWFSLQFREGRKFLSYLSWITFREEKKRKDWREGNKMWHAALVMSSCCVKTIEIGENPLHFLFIFLWGSLLHRLPTFVRCPQETRQHSHNVVVYQMILSILSLSLRGKRAIGKSPSNCFLFLFFLVSFRPF